MVSEIVAVPLEQEITYQPAFPETEILKPDTQRAARERSRPVAGDRETGRDRTAIRQPEDDTGPILRNAGHFRVPDQPGTLEPVKCPAQFEFQPGLEKAVAFVPAGETRGPVA